MNPHSLIHRVVTKPWSDCMRYYEHVEPIRSFTFVQTEHD